MRMRYERYIYPLAATAVATAAGLFWRERRRAQSPDEPGAFIYGYPLDLEEELSNELVSLVELESEVMDEEMFPGHHQD